MSIKWVRFYAADWRSGCYDLTIEQEGFYVRVCAHYYETGMRLPLDDDLACRRLRLDIRMYRRLKSQLLKIGKLYEADDGYYVPRAERELEAAEKAQGSQVGMGAARRSPHVEQDHGRDQAPADRAGWQADCDRHEVVNQQADNSVYAESASGGLRRDFAETSPRLLGEVHQNNVENQCPLKEGKKEEKSSSRARESFDAASVDPLALNRALIAAAEPALDNPANRAGILSCAIPLGWLRSGCDLDADVLPTLADLGRLRAGKKIRSWAYFTDAVYEARDRRLSGERPAKPAKHTYVPDPSCKIDAEAYMAEAAQRVAETDAMWRRAQSAAFYRPIEEGPPYGYRQ